MDKNEFKNALSYFDEIEVMEARRHVDNAREEIRQAEKVLRGTPLMVFDGGATIHENLSAVSEVLRDSPPIG